MKKVALALGLLLAFAAPLFAQGPFADVPTDHWAYEAVNQLQQDGILIGYPDGTFGGKRAMTRYEFAVAVARMIPVITGKTTGGVSQEEFNALKNQVNAIKVPDVSTFATKADVDAVRKLVDEFKDELAALGVDVDALKRDVATLNDRVTALEKEQARVKWNGEFNAFGTASSLVAGPVAFDRDDRAITTPNMLTNITALTDAFLTIKGQLTDTAFATASFDAGNYLSGWLGGAVDDYTVFTRPASDFIAGGTLTDAVVPYYINANFALGRGVVSFGRIPLQWTKYTIRKIDIDSYSNISYIDDGNYPVDGAKIDYNFGPVKVQAFAAKNNTNTNVSINGLTAQATSGLYNNVIGAGAPFHVLGGHAAGGLARIDQSAGARITLGTPFKGVLGMNYFQAAGSDVAVGPAVAHDSVNVWGADLNFGIGKFTIGGDWAQSQTLGIAGAATIGSRNSAVDGHVDYDLGRFLIGGGWKSIQRNFSAPGFWDKIGRWTNPTNIEGPYANLSYCIAPRVNFVADGAWYKGANTYAAAPVAGGISDAMNDTGDKVDHYNAGVQYGLSAANSVSLGMEWVRWAPGGLGRVNERYYNIGWGYQLNPSAGFKLSYQIAAYNAPAGSPVYALGGVPIRGDIATAQFGVKF